jgi:hypothetical protein
MRNLLIAAMLILATFAQAMPVHYDWMADGETMELYPPYYCIEPGNESPELNSYLYKFQNYFLSISHLWGRKIVTYGQMPSDKQFSFMSQPWALYYTVDRN